LVLGAGGKEGSKGSAKGSEPMEGKPLESRSLRDCLDLVKAREGLRYTQIGDKDHYFVTLLYSSTHKVLRIETKEALLEFLANPNDKK